MYPLEVDGASPLQAIFVYVSNFGENSVRKTITIEKNNNNLSISTRK